LQAWVEQLPNLFEQSGTILYNARNQIRLIVGPDGQDYVVKRFHKPALMNRLVYSLVRPPKAKRAYDNAICLLQRGIRTPQPVAYMLCGRGLIGESYLVTRKAEETEMLYRWGDGVTAGREDAMRAFGRYSGEMHEAGVLHLDYSPGNILYAQEQYTIVDINRMRWGKVSIRRGCRNLARLWGGKAMYRLIAEGYAQVRHADTEQCYQLMWQAHKHYWSHHSMPHTDLKLVME